MISQQKKKGKTAKQTDWSTQGQVKTIMSHKLVYFYPSWDLQNKTKEETWNARLSMFNILQVTGMCHNIWRLPSYGETTEHHDV